MNPTQIDSAGGDASMTSTERLVRKHYPPIPNGWKVRKLKFIARARTSNVDKITRDVETPVALCNYVDVYYNDTVTRDLTFMQGSATDAEIERFELRRDQVVVTKDSESWDDIAIPSYVPEDMPGVVCGYHLAVLTPDQEQLSGRYLSWLCRTESLNGQFKVSANGVTRYGLSHYAIKNALLSFPTVADQERIADFLDERTARIDRLIARKERLLALLAERRQALIARAVTAGLDPDTPTKPSGIDWLGDVPAHWEVGNIRRYADMRTGHTPSRQNSEYWADCTIPWFTLADVWQLRPGVRVYLGETAECISEVGLANSAAELLPTSTVILSRTASIGYTGIMPTPMATSQDFWNWICGPRLHPEYLLWQLRTMVHVFSMLTSGSTHKTIYRRDAASLRLMLPPPDEQERIAAHVNRRVGEIDKVVTKVGRSIKHLREYRSALITAAVTGQLDVTGEAA